MGSMRDEEYMTKFLELFKYVSYITNEKVKVHRFSSGFPLAFRDWIDYDEPRSLEAEVIGKLKHFYEHSNHKNESQQGCKGNDKGKGKQKSKITRPQNVEEKENVAPHKKFNAARQGHGSQQ